MLQGDAYSRGCLFNNPASKGGAYSSRALNRGGNLIEALRYSTSQILQANKFMVTIMLNFDNPAMNKLQTLQEFTIWKVFERIF